MSYSSPEVQGSLESRAVVTVVEADHASGLCWKFKSWGEDEKVQQGSVSAAGSPGAGVQHLLRVNPPQV